MSTKSKPKSKAKSAGSTSTRTRKTTHSGRSAAEEGRTEDTASVPAPPSGPVPRGLNDVRGDEAPVLGHSVEVTEGEHAGTFGTFDSLEGSEAVVTPRAAPLSRVTVPVTSLRPADSIRR